MRPGYCDHDVSLSVQCDQCSYERDYASGKAAGYAEAVADIRHLAETMATRLRSGDLANLLMILDSGAHVGAAKKGVSNG